MYKIITVRLLLLILFIPLDIFAQVQKKERVIVLTDIEADPDDTQSLIRFLLYSNQWDVEPGELIFIYCGYGNHL